MNVKIAGINLPLDWLIPVVMKALGKVVDDLVPGEKLSADQIKGVRTFYFLAHEWGKDAVESTSTDIDDAVLGKTIQLCEDTAEEGGFALPA